jgi:aminoglycoside phosphotransferase (APT) family kinase protein
MDVTDKSTRVRQGEELDLRAVERFLKSTIPGLSGELLVEQFPSGFSNLTYLIKVGDTDLVLRRPPFGRKAKTAHDMGREYRILKVLNPVFPYCPKPLVYTDDESIMGCPFYVMERIKGIIIRKAVPEGLNLSPVQVRTLCETLMDVQYELHSIDYTAIGLEGLGKPDGYVKRQVEGWSERYRAARTPDAPTFDSFMQWLKDNMPQDYPKPGIIHNDYKLDNVVLDPQDPTKIIGVLDWEMATIGDPIMDLGCSLGYWVHPSDSANVKAASMMPVDMPGLPTRDELLQRYSMRSGVQIANFDYYYCFGVFRIAVILQQIYYRYYHGQTKDERFKMLIFGVHIIDEEIKKFIKG